MEFNELIRTAVEDDFPRLREILIECTRESMNLESDVIEYLTEVYYPRFANFETISEEGTLFVYEKNNLVVGTGGLQHGSLITADDEEFIGYWIKRLYIDPKYQGHGIGSILFARLESTARKKNVENVMIEAFPNAVEFYLSKGYEEIRKYAYDIKGMKIPQVLMDKKI